MCIFSACVLFIFLRGFSQMILRQGSCTDNRRSAKLSSFTKFWCRNPGIVYNLLVLLHSVSSKICDIVAYEAKLVQFKQSSSPSKDW